MCGWVECQSFTIFAFGWKTEFLGENYGPQRFGHMMPAPQEANISVQELPKVIYDPKINPYWKIDGDSDNYEMIRVNTVVSDGKRLYILKM